MKDFNGETMDPVAAVAKWRAKGVMDDLEPGSEKETMVALLLENQERYVKQKTSGRHLSGVCGTQDVSIHDLRPADGEASVLQEGAGSEGGD